MHSSRSNSTISGQATKVLAAATPFIAGTAISVGAAIGIPGGLAIGAAMEAITIAFTALAACMVSERPRSGRQRTQRVAKNLG